MNTNAENKWYNTFIMVHINEYHKSDNSINIESEYPYLINNLYDESLSKLFEFEI